eukprot:TRINITY_DN472_c0_g3_i20.p1 TRINITY_DN472_c0_g3~~TRINITY_DN472_c0_g3_i20.p1  ORF type:complete len:162 (-),score=39.60 TRINITY_DN472_c0_g3_i20:52-537(-)
MQFDKESEMHVAFSKLLVGLLNSKDNSHSIVPTRTKLDSSKIPRMSIQDYIGRIHKHVKCSSACYLLAFILIERALRYNRCWFLTSSNVYSAVTASLTLAIKLLEDDELDMKRYARVVGYECEEVAAMEGELLKLINYELFVREEEYKLSLIHICRCRRAI